MKRTLMISLDSNADAYYVRSDDSEELMISSNSLTVSGKDIYKKFFYGQSIGERCDMTVNIDPGFKGSGHERIVIENIKKLFDSIIDAINDKVSNQDALPKGDSEVETSN